MVPEHSRKRSEPAQGAASLPTNSGKSAARISIIRPFAPHRPTYDDVLFGHHKTTPGHRTQEKYAVRVGGCHNHRAGLDDGILIKVNHIRAAGGMTPAVTAARTVGLC